MKCDLCDQDAQVFLTQITGGGMKQLNFCPHHHRYWEIGQTYTFSLDQKVLKVGGSYQATGTIKAQFRADDGSERYVFRFDNPAGLLHIFNAKNLQAL